MTPQLDTVIIEACSVKMLSLRGNTLKLYRAKHFPLIKIGPVVTQDITMAKLATLT